MKHAIVIGIMFMSATLKASGYVILPEFWFEIFCFFLGLGELYYRHWP